jgi:hypothetical protein
MISPERAELVSALSTVFQDWQRRHGADGCAIRALDALGYTAGMIFARAPDLECREYGREQFMSAMDEGLTGATIIDGAQLN